MAAVRDFDVQELLNALDKTSSPSQRWGPNCENTSELPFAVFSKRDHIGKPCDWSQTLSEGMSTISKANNSSRYNSQQFGEASFEYHHQQDESSFNIVDTKASTKNRKTYTKARFTQKKTSRQWEEDEDKATGKNLMAKQQPRRRKNRRWYARRWQNEAKELTSSVKISENWPIVSELPLKAFRSAVLPGQPTVERIEQIGSAKVYQKHFDRVSVRNSVALKRCKQSSFSLPSTSNDAVMQRLFAAKSGDVYLTDSMMGMLMAMSSSVASWDLVVTKHEDGSIVFDSRKLSRSGYLRVHETSSEVLPVEEESINHDDRLMEEATKADYSFRKQVLDEASVQSLGAAAEHPFRYQRFTLPSGLKVVVRCEASALSPATGTETGSDPKQDSNLLYIRSLLEFDARYTSGVSWKEKLETQRGFVIATEFKNNMFKMSRFIAEALVADAEFMRIGFVSRTSPADATSHVIMGTLKSKPSQLALQVGVKESGLWGSLNSLLETVQGLNAGSYLLFRAPNTDCIRLYSVPKDTFAFD